MLYPRCALCRVGQTPGRRGCSAGQVSGIFAAEALRLARGALLHLPYTVARVCSMRRLLCDRCIQPSDCSWCSRGGRHGILGLIQRYVCCCRCSLVHADILSAHDCFLLTAISLTMASRRINNVTVAGVSKAIDCPAHNVYQLFTDNWCHRTIHHPFTRCSRISSASTYTPSANDLHPQHSQHRRSKL